MPILWCNNSLLALPGESSRVEFPKIPARFTGTGDLFAALLLAWSHEGLQASDGSRKLLKPNQTPLIDGYYSRGKSPFSHVQCACEKAVSTMHAVLRRTLKCALGECECS